MGSTKIKSIPKYSVGAYVPDLGGIVEVFPDNNPIQYRIYAEWEVVGDSCSECVVDNTIYAEWVLDSCFESVRRNMFDYGGAPVGAYMPNLNNVADVGQGVFKFTSNHIIVSDGVRRDWIKFEQAVYHGDVTTLHVLFKKYAEEAHKGSTNGCCGPGAVKMGRRGVHPLWESCRGFLAYYGGLGRYKEK